MNDASPSSPSLETRKPRRARARQACARCRRQKLKCDNLRPCAGCARLGVTCKERVAASRSQRETAPASGPNISIFGKVPRHPREDEVTQLEPPVVPPPTCESHTTHHEDLSAFNLPCSTPGSSDAYRERRSTYEVVDQLFRDHNSRATLQHTTDAIPGGSPEARSADNGQYSTVLEAIGIDLPPRHVINFAIETYVNAVHWFMLLFHEPSLRAELQMILGTGLVRTDRVSFLLLATLVIGVGAKYADQREAQLCCTGHDLDNLGSQLIRVIESRMLEIFDNGGIEAVQISIVLSSYYLYHGQPKRSLALSGSTLKIATALRLQRESTWKISDPIEREVWRGLAWAIYTSEVFSAISHGTPCIIQDSEWDVQLPKDTDETLSTCPGFDSSETFEGETFGPITLGSYQRYKFRLYRIASSITRNVYARSGATVTEIVREIKSINDRLLGLEKCIPLELRLRYLKDAPVNDETRWTVKTFQLQALALRLSYDNILLVLHRPLLTMNRVSTWPPASTGYSTTQLESGTTRKDSTDSVNEMIKTSKYQCWVSAMRTSRIGEHGKILTASRNTHGAAYAGIQTFTAGVALGIFALSDPLSDQAHQAKRAIGKIIKLPKLHGFRTIVSDQCGTILEELVRIIMAEEMKCLLSSSESENSPATLDAAGQLRSPKTQNSRFGHRNMATQWVSPGNTYPVAAHHHDAPGGSSEADPTRIDPPQEIVDGNFSDALLSLQDVFRDGGVLGYTRPASNVRDSNSIRNLTTSNSHFVATANPERSVAQPRSTTLFESTSQAWIWDDILWLPDTV